jgi:hypothetical protein
MPPNDNRRPGVVSRNGGDYDSSSNSAKVIPLFPKLNTASPFDRMTARIILEQHRNGTLQEGVLLALLAGVGLHP